MLGQHRVERALSTMADKVLKLATSNLLLPANTFGRTEVSNIKPIINLVQDTASEQSDADHNTRAMVGKHESQPTSAPQNQQQYVLVGETMRMLKQRWASASYTTHGQVSLGGPTDEDNTPSTKCYLVEPH